MFQDAGNFYVLGTFPGYSLGKTIEYNLLTIQNMTYREPFLYSLKCRVSQTFPGQVHEYYYDTSKIIILYMRNVEILIFLDIVLNQKKTCKLKQL